MSKSTAALILAVLALVVSLGGAIAISNANAPVELAAANDVASFPRGFAASRSIANSTPVVIANAQSTGVPFQAQANGTPIASISRAGVGTFAGGLSVVAGTVGLPTGSLTTTALAGSPLGVTGTFTSGAGLTITVTNGVIVAIGP